MATKGDSPQGHYSEQVDPEEDFEELNPQNRQMKTPSELKIVNVLTLEIYTGSSSESEWESDDDLPPPDRFGCRKC